MSATDAAMFVATGLVAAVVNTLAGGGPVLTLGILSLTGVDPRIANLTSTVALSPGQLVAGYDARAALRGAGLAHPHLLLIGALVGGAIGAGLLLLTSSSSFRTIVPWLILLATGVYAWNGWRAPTVRAPLLDRRALPVWLAPLSVYGGYFGGGNSFLVLAVLGLSGHDTRAAGQLKNVLIAAINLGAVVVLAGSGLVDWGIAAALGIGGIIGSIIGVRLLGRIPAAAIRLLVVVFGLCLSGWMFAR